MSPWKKVVAEGPDDWGDVVPDVKRPRDRLTGIPVPITNPWEKIREPMRHGFENPMTGVRTLDEFGSDILKGKLTWEQIEEAMRTVTPDERRTLMLEMLSNPKSEKYQDVPPIGEGRVWRKRIYRNYDI